MCVICVIKDIFILIPGSIYKNNDLRSNLLTIAGIRIFPDCNLRHIFSCYSVIQISLLQLFPLPVLQDLHYLLKYEVFKTIYYDDGYSNNISLFSTSNALEDLFM